MSLIAERNSVYSHARNKVLGQNVACKWCNLVLVKHSQLDFFFLWRFDTIPGHGLTLRGFAITLIGYNTIRGTPLYVSQAGLRNFSLTKHNTHNKHPFPRWDSNPRSQKANCQTVRPLGSANN